jgi:aminopeptidase N
VYPKQTQEGAKFSMPMAIDVYAGGSRTRHQVWMKSAADTFRLPCSTTPDLVNVDAEKTMLWRKTDNKPAAQWNNQYVLARNYYDRREALDWTSAHYDSSALLRSLMVKALSDPFEGLRQQAIRFWSARYQLLNASEWQTLENIARSDKDRRTRAAAIDVLAKKANPAYQALFEKGLTDSSYTVAGASLEALLLLNPELAKNKTAELKKDAEGRLANALQTAALQQREPADWEQVVAEYKKQNVMQRNQQNKGMILYASKLKDTTAFRQVVGPAIEYAKGTAPDFGGMRAGTTDMLGWLMEEKRRQLAAKPNDAMLAAQVKYLEEKMRK